MPLCSLLAKLLSYAWYRKLSSALQVPWEGMAQAWEEGMAVEEAWAVGGLNMEGMDLAVMEAEVEAEAGGLNMTLWKGSSSWEDWIHRPQRRHLWSTAPSGNLLILPDKSLDIHDHIFHRFCYLVWGKLLSFWSAASACCLKADKCRLQV